MDTLTQYDALRRRVDRLCGERDGLLRSKQTAEQELVVAEQEIDNAKKARTVLQLVAQTTQQELEYHVSSLGSMALRAVFPEDPYKIQLRFDQKRGRTEAVLRFIRERDNMEIKPYEACGGGAVLVAAFALRLTFWRMAHKKTAPIMFLDEPFNYLSKDLMEKAAEVLREIAQKLKIQIIMVTHEEELLAGVDRVFSVSIRKGKSRIQRK